MKRTMLSSNLLILLLLVVQQQQRFVGAEERKPEDKADSADEDETLRLDPTVIRDAIASVLRGSDGGSQGNRDDGYAEAAQEYLEHVQTVLAAAATPSELYIREQLADLDTLSQLLSQLNLRSLNEKSALRLVARLLKGPAKDLILPTLIGLESEFAYSHSATAQRLSDAAQQLRDFLSKGDVDGAKDSDSVTDRLRSHAERVEAGSPVREFLDGVLDRMLELEGKKVRFNVEFPDANSESDASNRGDSKSPPMGEPRVSRLPDSQDDQDNEDVEDDKDSSRYSSSSAKKSTSSTEDDGGRNLFDQVLCRRAAESVAAALVKDGDDASGDETSSNKRKSASARLRIQELRRRQYQPAGFEAMLEAIEDCL